MITFRAEEYLVSRLASPMVTAIIPPQRVFYGKIGPFTESDIFYHFVLFVGEML